MTKQPSKKSAPNSSQTPSNPPLTPEQEEIYNRDTCQKCNRPVTPDRMSDCKVRRFWPVCEECEEWLIPKVKEGMEKMAKMQQKFG